MAGCDPLDVTCGTAAWAPDGGAGALDQLATAVTEALDTSIRALGTIWATVSTPSLTGGAPAVTAGEAPPEAVAAVETVLSYVLWVSLGVAVLSLIGLGALLALAGRRGDGERHLGRLGVVLGGVVLVSAAAALVGALVPAERFAGGTGPAVTTQNALWWFTAGMAVLSVLVAGAKMAWEQRAAPGRDLLRSLLTLVVVAGAGLTVIGLSVVAADSFATWLLDRVTGGADFGARVAAMLRMSGEMGVLLVVVLGLVGVLAAVVQIMLMVLRGAMLVILAGIFPLSASFTNTAVGRAWFHRVIGWIIAFVLYKPAVAIVYATAFQLVDAGVVGDDGTGLVPVLAGLILMILALLALPALLAVTVPLVHTVTTGPAAAPAAAGSAALTALPTGAVLAHRAPSGAVGPVGLRPSGEVRALAPLGAAAEGPAGSGPIPGPGSGAGADPAGALPWEADGVPGPSTAAAPDTGETPVAPAAPAAPVAPAARATPRSAGGDPRSDPATSGGAATRTPKGDGPRAAHR